MVKAQKLNPAVSRKWLTYGLITLAVIIGSILIYRATMGQTIKETRVMAAKDKEARDLVSKSPGNAEAFSTRLESRRKEMEEEAARAAADTKTSPTTATTTPDASSIVKKPSLMPSGAPSSSTMSDEQIEAYANLKAQNERGQSAKLAAWERGSAGGGLDMLQAMVQGQTDLQAIQANGANPARPAQGGANTVTDLMSAYLKAQGQTGPSKPNPLAIASSTNTSSTAKDAQFVQGLDAKEIRPPLRVQAGPGRYAVLEGTAIHIVMRTAVSSELPGTCRAMVERDVFDTVTQSIRLIPAGSTVICAYNAETNVGQERLLLAFTRLIFPNGTSVALGGMESADEQGKIGAKADVNTRFFSRFGSALMIAGIGVLTQGVVPLGGGTTINMPGASSSGAGTQALGEVAKKSFERNLNIKEELTLAPGDRLRVIVTRDMVLDPALTKAGNY